MLIPGSLIKFFFYQNLEYRMFNFNSTMVSHLHMFIVNKVVPTPRNKPLSMTSSVMVQFDAPARSTINPALY